MQVYAILSIAVGVAGLLVSMIGGGATEYALMTGIYLFCQSTWLFIFSWCLGYTAADRDDERKNGKRAWEVVERRNVEITTADDKLRQVQQFVKELRKGS